MNAPNYPKGLNRKQRRELDRLREKAYAGCARPGVQVTAQPDQEENRTWLLHKVWAERASWLPLCAEHTDPVVYACWPDADDRAYIDALCEAHGTPKPPANAAFHITVHERRTLLRMLEATGVWSQRHLDDLRAPAAGAVVIVYDGTACGHGVCQIVRTSAGGAA